MTESDEARRARLRKLWRAFWKACEAQRQQRQVIDQSFHEALIAWGDSDAPLSRRPRDPIHPPMIPFPDILRGLTCGAKTRAGTPCKRSDLATNGRCKFHGGLSTGPITEAGKAIASRNSKRTP